MRRTLVVGDVHGCAWELKKLLRQTRPERVVLVGDLFTRGPDPLGVWRLIQRYEARTALGNNDQLVLRKWRAGRDLPKLAMRWLARQHHLFIRDRFLVAHAGVHPWRPLQTRRRRALFETQFLGQHWSRNYRGRRLVLYGHEGKRGIQDRRPYSLGLDTQCVRGGALSGYLVGEDEIVQVQARERYS
jgi:hypothetical protein